MYKAGNLFVVFTILICFSTFPAYSKTAIDPSEIGVGARAIGLGRAFVGLADDASSIFINPAGSGNFNSMQFISMQTKLLGENQYIVVGDAYPTNYGTFGIGYIGTQSPDSPVTIRSSSTNRIEATGQNISASRNIFLFSYGKSLSKKISVGTNFKVYSANLSNADGGSASGTNLDIGILIKPQPCLSLGATVTNILPNKLTWATGNKEDFTTSFKLGSSIKMCGENGLYKGFGDFNFLADTETNSQGTVLRVGGEWSPIQYITLRAGLDQRNGATGNGSITPMSNLVGGVGFNLSGWSFDFAYQGYDNLAENNSYFCSIRYTGISDKGTEKKPTSKIEMLNEKIVYSPIFSAIHIVHNENIKSIKVNEKATAISGGKFFVNQPLALGKNKIFIEMFDAEGNIPIIAKIDVIRLISFKDVTANCWAKDYIEKAAAAGIIGGYADGTFGPDKNISRAEFSKLLTRLSENIETSPTKISFKDVAEDHWASGYIQNAAQLGLIQGYPNKTFKPNSPIKVEEGIAMIVRFTGIDVSKYNSREHWTSPYIAAAKDAGIIENTNLAHSELLTRDQAIAMLSKTNIGKQIIAKKLNLEEPLKTANLR